MKGEAVLTTAELALTKSFGSMDAAMEWVHSMVDYFVEHYGENESPDTSTGGKWVCCILPKPAVKTPLVLPPGAVLNSSNIYSPEPVVLIRNCVNNVDQANWNIAFTRAAFALVRQGSVLPIGGGYGLVAGEDILLYRRLPQ